jgi:PIN domain nuclease of toxin-antitoxin system
MVLVLTVVHLKEDIVKFHCEIKVSIRIITRRKMILLLITQTKNGESENRNTHATFWKAQTSVKGISLTPFL